MCGCFGTGGGVPVLIHEFFGIQWVFKLAKPGFSWEKQWKLSFQEESTHLDENNENSWKNRAEGTQGDSKDTTRGNRVMDTDGWRCADGGWASIF